VPDKVSSAPSVAVARLAGQLNVDAAQIRLYVNVRKRVPSICGWWRSMWVGGRPV